MTRPTIIPTIIIACGVSVMSGLSRTDSRRPSREQRDCHKVQLTTDGSAWYVDAVDHAFGIDIDYGMIQKHYAGGSADKAATSLVWLMSQWATAA